jgi:hypothetical protein
MPGVDCGVWKFKSESVNDLTDAIERSLSQTGMDLSKGQEFVVREFSPGAIGQRAEVIYEEAIRRG